MSSGNDIKCASQWEALIQIYPKVYFFLSLVSDLAILSDPLSSSHLSLQKFPHPCILDEDDQGGVANLSCSFCQLAQLENLFMAEFKMKMKVMTNMIECGMIKHSTAEDTLLFARSRWISKHCKTAQSCASMSMHCNEGYNEIEFMLECHVETRYKV